MTVLIQITLLVWLNSINSTFSFIYIKLKLIHLLIVWMMIYKSVYFSMRAKIGSRLGANVSIKSISFSTSRIHVAPLDVLLLPSNLSPSLICLVVKFGNHWLKVSCIVKSSSLVHWLLYLRPFDVQFFLLMHILIGNDALFYFLVFKSHLLYILTNLKNPFP